MNAAFIEKTGSPAEIKFGQLDEPNINPDEVLVAVEAVSVNPIDTYIRSGAVPMNLPFPFIVGSDFAGTVSAIGSQVREIKLGDRVWGSNQGIMGRQGTFAERISVEQKWVYPLPPEVPTEIAAATSLVGITAYLGLIRVAHLEKGETLFVHGGSGGVGSMVVQIAKIIGATVITTAGNPTKAEYCREIGADEVILYNSENLADAIRKSVRHGIDVWWETSREPDLQLAVESLARGGRVIVMAGREARPQIPIGSLYVKDCSVHGFAMFNATPKTQREAAELLNTWMADGDLRPIIGRTLPLSEAASAHRLQEEKTLSGKSDFAGKIVLQP